MTGSGKSASMRGTPEGVSRPEGSWPATAAAMALKARQSAQASGRPSQKRIKRFYKAVSVDAIDRHWRVTLDGRPVRSPAKRLLELPARPLAEAVAAEFAAQQGFMRPETMPLTALCNAAVDRIGPERDQFVVELARFGETDLICYFADEPDRLVALQRRIWRPLMAWAEAKFDAALRPVSGIMPAPQPEAAIDALRRALGAPTHFGLTGLYQGARLSGSLVIGFALLHRELDSERAFDAAILDEAFQADAWGADTEAEARRGVLRAELASVARFVALLGDSVWKGSDA